MKHIKGEWRIINAKSIAGNGWDIIDKDNHTIFTSNLANAHLIAAAPDLLEACKMCADNIRYGHEISLDREDVNRLYKAISKAEGGKE